MTKASDVTGLILAGGKSRRFGADKARHAVGGRPMIEHVVGAVSAVCTSVLISLGAETPTFDLPDVRYVRDQFPEAGPLAGLHAGLLAAGTPWLLAVACDMPFLTREELQALLKARTASAQAVVAQEDNGRLHPLCACYRRDTVGVAGAQLRAGQRALHAFLHQLESVRTVLLPEAALRNVNTPSDLSAPDKNTEGS